jgi:import inner membrane translocase subunit TIM54
VESSQKLTPRSGLPANFGRKLPSRNWTIFLTIVATWTGAVIYDRQEKKRIQKKWCDAVSHLAKEPIPVSALQRKLTIYLSAPPADGLLTTREHFHEYVKPILFSAGLDWDAVEGRKEGDVRAATAEAIRKLRKMKGEQSNSPLLEDDLDVTLAELHKKAGVREFDGPAGDIVIGRNTWKEYIRGLHEGWLGPLDAPKAPEEAPQDDNLSQEESVAPTDVTPHSERPHDIASIPNYAAEQVLSRLPHHDKPKSELVLEGTPITILDSASSSDAPIIDDASPSANTTPNEEAKAEEPTKEDAKADEKPKKPPQPPPFISTSAYSSATPPSSFPQEFAPSVALPVPHILGFMNTHIRIYRYLTRRYLAEDIGRQVAAACFAAYRPYEHVEGATATSTFPSDSASPSAGFSSVEPTHEGTAEPGSSE